MELASGLQIAAVDRPGTDDLVLLFRRVIYESYGMARTRNPTFFGVLAMVIRTRRRTGDVHLDSTEFVR